MKKIYFLILNILFLGGTAQVLHETFSSSTSTAWVQFPVNSWTISPNLGSGGGACLLTEEAGSGSVAAIISTPTISLAGLINPTLTLKAAVVRNNFMAPAIHVGYNDGTPQNTQLGRWGAQSHPGATHTMNETADFTPPLDSANVEWTTITHTFNPGSDTIRLSFSAEFVNGGYALIDEIVLSATTNTSTTGSGKNTLNASVRLFPNPAQHSLRLYYTGQREIRVFNMLGSSVEVRISHAENGQAELALSPLAAGAYFVSLRDKTTGTVQTLRFVKAP